MPVKSSMTKPDKKKKVKVNRDVVIVIPEVAPEVPETPEVVPEEPLVEVLKEMGITDKNEQVEKVEKARVFINLHGIDEAERLVDLMDEEERLVKLMDESSCAGDGYDPTSPVSSPKRVRLKKPSAPKPLVNEKGEYLNPRTNRYVKSGTSAYKQLVKEGIIVVVEEPKEPKEAVSV